MSLHNPFAFDSSAMDLCANPCERMRYGEGNFPTDFPEDLEVIVITDEDRLWGDAVFFDCRDHGRRPSSIKATTVVDTYAMAKAVSRQIADQHNIGRQLLALKEMNSIRALQDLALITIWENRIPSVSSFEFLKESDKPDCILAPTHIPEPFRIWKVAALNWEDTNIVWYADIPSSPIRDLLSCSVGEISEKARDLLRNLSESPKSRKFELLDQLSNILKRPNTDYNIRNRMAAMEMLALAGAPQASEVLKAELVKRPLAEEHVLLATLTRRATISSADVPRIVEGLTEILLELRSIDSQRNSFATPLKVEILRALATLDTSSLAVVLEATPLEDLELTAVLEAAAKNLQSARGEHRQLCRTLCKLWDSTMSRNISKTVGNFPGIVAQLFELRCRLGADPTSLLMQIEKNDLYHRLIYQILQRQLDFMPKQARADLYKKVLQGLKSRSFWNAFAKAITLITADRSVDATTIITSSLT